MKWHSVKDYKIPANIGYLFVALEVDELCTYSIAQYRHNILTDKFNWFDKDGNTLIQVTHFCIPEPIAMQ